MPLPQHLHLWLALTFISTASFAADGLQSLNTYKKAYGDTKNPVTVDPAKDLPRIPAQSPDEALKSIKIKTGFAVQHVAHEPQVRSPIALSFDELGRMFVVEMIDYSELRDASPHLGRVSRLEDKDGDGYFETSMVFADDLPWPTGVICSRGGIYVASTPDIWFFKDEDGDGRAEVRQKVFTGFGTGLKVLNVQGLINCFNWGLDGSIHMQCGGGNRGKIKCLLRPDAPEIEIGGKDFVFDPMTHQFSLEVGGGQYGFSYDSWGHKFVCSNSDHLQYFVHDGRFEGLPVPRRSIAVDGGAAEVFRASPDEPWRIIRTRWRISGVVKGAVEGGGRVSGYFTGATGTTAFKGDAYGPEFVNNTFSGDAGGNLVHRKLIQPDGASLKGQRPADEQGMEFLASTHTWFRPVNFANAPDGCLYVIDMHREVIEHPWSIPDEIKQYTDLNSGNDRGRIYRVVRSGQAKPPARVPLPSEAAALVKLLDHDNGWHRETAARLLIERREAAAAPLAKALLTGSNKAQSRFAALHLLGALAGAGLESALTQQDIIAALADSDEHVREAGLQLALLTQGQGDADFLAAVKARLSDPSPRVQMFACLALGSANDSAIGQQMLAVAAKTNDTWVHSAILAAKPEVLSAAFLADPQAALSNPLAVSLLESLGARNQASEVSTALEVVATKGDAKLIAALGRGLRKGGSSLSKADTSKRLAEVFAKAIRSASDALGDEASRLAALPLIALTSGEASTQALLSCLGKEGSPKLQQVALGILADQLGDKAAPLMLQSWPGLRSEARATAIASLIERPASAKLLLETWQAKASAPASPQAQDSSPTATPQLTDLAASQVQALLKHSDKAVAALANEVLASVKPKSRAEVIAAFQPALTLKGDVGKGQLQFMQRCFACHRAGTQGMAVGPDLITVKAKGREGILTAILDPHKEVAAQFIAFTVSTKDGQTMSGIVTKDDATSLTLKGMGGIETAFARSNLKGSSSTGQSLMPEGLEVGMDAQSMADLLSFIEGL